MKNKSLLRTVCSRIPLVFFLAAMIAIDEVQAERVSLSDFKSKWLKMLGGGMWGDQKEKKPTLVIQFKNKKRKALWVKVHFDNPQPNQDCESTKEVKRKGKVIFHCIQQNIVAETDYPVLVAIYSDESLTTLLEENETKFFFDKKDVEALQQLMAQSTPTQPQLPVSFNNIVHSKKPRGPAVAFSTFKKPGTLTLGESGIEYVNKRNKIAIPYTALRSASINELGPSPAYVWLVIDYQEGSEGKSIGFQPSAFRGDGGDLSKMHATVKFVLREKAPVERIRIEFDGRQWSEGYRTEKGDQIVKEFVLPGESVENWTELVTAQTLPGLQTRMTAKKIMLQAKKTTLKKCPNAVWNVIDESKEEIVYEWRTTGCPGWDDQYEVSKLMRGTMAVHRFAYTNKKLPISEDRRVRWIGLMDGAELELLQR